MIIQHKWAMFSFVWAIIDRVEKLTKSIEECVIVIDWNVNLNKDKKW